jgi:hypothetical protein
MKYTDAAQDIIMIKKKVIFPDEWSQRNGILLLKYYYLDLCVSCQFGVNSWSM